jgi:GTP-binding protein
VFLDEAEIELRSGSGGDGSATFHREKFVPRGGPNGADGGRGGNVILLADRHQRTLYDVKLRRLFQAGDGTAASGNKMGKNGEDVIIRQPVGTVVYDALTDDPIIDLNIDGMQYVICKGGKGGLGNIHYTNSIRQAPTFAQKGAPRETLVTRLELKMLADVGLVGLPNAGKSTLLSVVSAATPKIASYPFTTITPNLGVVKVSTNSFIMADLPGLIEGASEGHGLGHQFLRHVERTKVLVHVVDAFPVDETDPVSNYRQIEKELELYSDKLAKRPCIIALNKTDLAPQGDVDVIVELFREEGLEVFPISGVAAKGLDPLLFEIERKLKEVEMQPDETIITPVLRAKEDGNWEVVMDEDEFVIKGARIIKMVAMTDLGNSEAVRYLHRRLERLGVIQRLRDLGADEGDTVRVGDWAFTFTER